MGFYGNSIIINEGFIKDFILKILDTGSDS